MQLKKHLNKAMLLAFVSVLVPIGHLFAQDPGGPGGPPDGVLVPIDGGLSLLLAAGASYGVKKIYDSRKKSKQKAESESGSVA